MTIDFEDIGGPLDGPYRRSNQAHQFGQAAPKAVQRVGDIDGAVFALDAPTTVEAVWGEDTEVLWAAGEPLLLYGPDGVGKTTIVQQIALARCGILPADMLGYPVAVKTTGCVLYLALDRPRQIARSIRRMVSEEHRPLLSERLRVWSGSLPFDVVAAPHALAAFGLERKAHTIIIDGVKDLARSLSDEDTGMALHRAWQLCIEADIEVAGLHHPRKAQEKNRKPNTLADVYGSRWITAGCGSIILVWGDAGDPVVDLSHLKQPAEVVGPLKLLHDNVLGTTTVAEKIDPAAIVLGHVGPGLNAREITISITGDTSPVAKDIEKVRRRLNSAVKQGRIRTHITPGEHGEEIIFLPAENSEKTT